MLLAPDSALAEDAAAAAAATAAAAAAATAATQDDATFVSLPRVSSSPPVAARRRRVVGALAEQLQARVLAMSCRSFCLAVCSRLVSAPLRIATVIGD